VFDTHAVERLEGTTRQDNVAMRRTFRAVGFVKEAHYRRGWPAPRRDGRLLDAVGYALLRTDWRDGTTTPVEWHDAPDALDGPAGCSPRASVVDYPWQSISPSGIPIRAES
jgi:hypothetical protein